MATSDCTFTTTTAPSDVNQQLIADSGAKYTLGSRVGAGSEGVVDLAFDEARGRTVAIKRLHAKDSAHEVRLKREFRVASGLTHKNLVELYELGTVGGRPYFTMEYIEGITPSEHIRAAGSANVEALLACAIQLLQGLSALSARGVIHRDIKPSNILVESGGRLVLLDFGLSQRPLVAGEGGFGGTLAYAAPELLTGAIATERSDIYAAGVVILELATGSIRRRPGSAFGLGQPDLTALSSLLPQAVVHLVGRMLDEDQRARPLAAEAAHALAAQLGSTADAVRTPFVGRESELGAIRASLDAVETQGRGGALIVRGPGGIGKTGLLERFCIDAQARGDALVVRGRAQLNEVVPFSGLDEVVDGLLETARVSRQSAELLPECRRLTRVFGARDWATDASPEPDPSQLQADAVEAFHRLVCALSDEHPGRGLDRRRALAGCG
jgi:hypothetical protein